MVNPSPSMISTSAWLRSDRAGRSTVSRASRRPRPARLRPVAERAPDAVASGPGRRHWRMCPPLPARTAGPTRLPGPTSAIATMPSSPNAQRAVGSGWRVGRIWSDIPGFVLAVIRSMALPRQIRPRPYSKAELPYQRQTPQRVPLGATAPPAWGFTVGGAGTVHWSDDEGDRTPWVLDGGSRHDRTRTLRIDVHNRAFTVGGFSPRVSVVLKQRDSNAQLHDYERVFGELSFVRLF